MTAIPCTRLWKNAEEEAGSFSTPMDLGDLMGLFGEVGAIVVEEGLTAWVFSRAKQLDFFERQTSLSFDLLKTVQQFVRGYEVEKCSLNLWENAILRGYEVFRPRLSDTAGGWVTGTVE